MWRSPISVDGNDVSIEVALRDGIISNYLLHFVVSFSRQVSLGPGVQDVLFIFLNQFWFSIFPGFIYFKHEMLCIGWNYNTISIYEMFLVFYSRVFFFHFYKSKIQFGFSFFTSTIGWKSICLVFLRTQLNFRQQKPLVMNWSRFYAPFLLVFSSFFKLF